MFAVVRETGSTLRMLWTNLARVLASRWSALVLLFSLGWLGYFFTVMISGEIAPRWSWTVIPLMGAGCLVQLMVTLAAYRMSIQESESAMGVTALPPKSFIALVSSLLFPFAAAFSVFGYFEDYAKDAMYYTSAMSGTFADSKFLSNLNPLQSWVSLLVTVGVFIGLWVVVRLISFITRDKESAFWSILSAFLSATMTFLVLFSLFRLTEKAMMWLRDRTFMAWKDQALAWLGDVIRLDVPYAISVAWAFLMEEVWPIFWQALSQPVVWLAIVAMVGGMQFVGVDTIWNKWRDRLGFRSNEETTEIVINTLPDFIVETAEAILRALHMFAVVLRSGAPFLAALVVSFTAIEWAGQWLEYLVDFLIGPLTSKYVMMFYPVSKAMPMIVVRLLQAVLLSVAYVHLRHVEVDLGPDNVFKSRRDSRKQAADSHNLSTQTTTLLTPTKTRLHVARGLTAVVLVTVVAAVFSITDPSDAAHRIHRMTLDEPTQLMTHTVTLSDLRVGTSIKGEIQFRTVEDPIESLGVFVAVRVKVSGYGSGGVRVEAKAGKVIYDQWDDYKTVIHLPGFSSTQDIAFEVPRDALDDLVIVVSPRQPQSTILALGHYRVPPDTPIRDLVVIDENSIEEAPR